MLLREVKQVKQSLILYYDWADDFEELTDEEVGKLINAILKYDMTGEVTEFSDRNMRTIFRHMRRQCDYNSQKYEERCEVNRENGKKGGAPKGNKNAQLKEKTTERLNKQPKTTENNQKQPKQPDKDKDIDKDIDSVFTLSSGNNNNVINNNIYNINKHTQDLVRSYFRDMKFRSDPDRFIDYNTSKGNTAVFDDPDRWQALARLWESNEKKKPPDRMMTHGTSYADIEDKIFNK